MSAAARIRVLVADDSVVLRDALVALLADDPRIEVMGVAADGAEAVERAAALRPDVITMDIFMPRLDGLAAAARIMAESPARILMITSARDRELDLAMRALEVGALELIPKPRTTDGASLRAWGRELAESIRIMSEVPVVRRRRSAPLAPVVVPALDASVAADAIAIVASTGGPPALARILGALPADLRAPILVAQHMAGGFVEGLVRWLGETTPLRAAIAASGIPSLPGHVYFAPERSDLEVDAERRLRIVPSEGGHCPSGDRLLASFALAYGSRGVGVVLTGMGDDGARGLLALRRAGGLTIAQDPATCVVAGMPQAAKHAGAVLEVVPLAAIAMTLRTLVEVSARAPR